MIGTVTKNRGSRLLLAAIAIVTLLRAVFVWLMGLMPQDAYYFFYSEHPAMSYFDHPAGIAWILKGFTSLFGQYAFVVKLADTVTTLLTVIAFYILARYFLGPHRSRNALLLFFSTLMVTVLSLVTTPDVPLMLFWTLSLICMYQAVFLERNAWWIWTGLAMGLAFNSKYTAVFLPAGLFLFLLLTNRRKLATPWPWISICVCGLTALPVVIWNFRNNFASFRFQSANRAGNTELDLLHLLGVLGHQAAILIPVLLFGLLYFLYKVFRKYRGRLNAIPQEQLFLLCFFLPVFFGFLFISVFHWVKLNWMMPAYISGIIWLSAWFGARYVRWQWIGSMAVHVALALEMLFYPVPVKSDDVWIGWKELAVKVSRLEDRYPEDFIFAADDYKTSAVLNFYLDSMVYARNIIGMPALQFDYIGTDLHRLAGRNAIFLNSIPDIISDQDEKEFVAQLQPYFRNISQMEPLVIKKGGRVVRRFLVYRCMHYRPPGYRVMISAH